MSKKVWAIFALAIGLFAFTFCLAGCGNGPEDCLIVEAAKKVIVRVPPGTNPFLKGGTMKVDEVKIIKRLKSYESSFEDPGDTTTCYPVRVNITFENGASETVDFTVFKRKRDDSWWCKTKITGQSMLDTGGNIQIR